MIALSNSWVFPAIIISFAGYPIYACDGTAFTKHTQRLVSIPHIFFFFYFLTKWQKRYRSKMFKTYYAVIPKTTGGSKISKCYDVTGKTPKQEEVGKSFLPAGIHSRRDESALRKHIKHVRNRESRRLVYFLSLLLLFSFRWREGECVYMVWESTGTHPGRDTDLAWPKVGKDWCWLSIRRPNLWVRERKKKNQVWSGRRQGGTPVKGKQKSACQTTRTPRPPLTSCLLEKGLCAPSSGQGYNQVWINLYVWVNNVIVSHVCSLFPVTNWSNRYNVTKTLNTFPLRDSIHVRIRRLDRWRLINWPQHFIYWSLPFF